MFYKVMKNGQVIDVLDRLVLVKYQPKHDILLLCDEKDAQAFLSSDGTGAWHELSLDRLPTDKYDTAELHPIDPYEYEQLKKI